MFKRGFLVALLSLPWGIAPDAKPLEYDRRTPVVDVVNKVSPSVVVIRTDMKRTVAVNPFEGFMFGFRGSGDQYVQEKVYTSAGSGIIVDNEGTVITNGHVVADANRLTCTTSDGSVHNLTLVGVDNDFDLAVLQIDQAESGSPKVFQSIDWGKTSDLMIGETVVVIGSALSFENSVSTGVVSALERTISVPSREKPYFGMIQTDAAINRGNSGGPLANIRGELIGITTLIATEGGGSDGIGFAIPVERVTQVYNEFVHGIVSLEERLGIEYVSQKSFEDIDPGQAQRLGLTGNRVEGLIAASLDPKGLGAQNGMHKGDLLIEIDGREVSQLAKFQRALEEHGPAKDLEITVLRFDPASSKVERLGIRIPAAGLTGMERIEQSDYWFGFEVRGLNNEIADRLGVSIDDGVVIRKIASGSPAQDAGLAAGDVIAAINRFPIQTMGDFRRLRHALQDEKTVKVSIRRGNRAGEVEVGGAPVARPAIPRQRGKGL
jgi:serine protease Do